MEDLSVALKLNPNEIKSACEALVLAATHRKSDPPHDVIIGRDMVGVLYVTSSYKARIYKSFEIDTDGHRTRRY